MSFKNKVYNTPGGARVLNCFLCGSCTAGCPVNEIDDSYNPRKIMRKILLDQDDVLKTGEIWKCNQCHACVCHCPQDVRFADVIRSLREIAVEEGIVPESLALLVEKFDLELRKDRLAKVNEAVSKI